MSGMRFCELRSPFFSSARSLRDRLVWCYGLYRRRGGNSDEGASSAKDLPTRQQIVYCARHPCTSLAKAQVGRPCTAHRPLGRDTLDRPSGLPKRYFEAVFSWVDSVCDGPVKGNSNAKCALAGEGYDFCSTLPPQERGARVAELADARDLGSRGKPWGFKSPLSHHRT